MPSLRCTGRWLLERMRILFHHRIGSKDGQFVHIEALTRALEKQGHEIFIVGPRGTGRQHFGGESSRIAWLKRKMPGAFYELLELGYSIPAYFRLARAIRRRHPDVIYERYNLFFPAGIIAKRRFKLPLLLEVNAPLFEERQRYGGLRLKGLARWSEHFTWRGADAVFVVTDVLGDVVRQSGVPPHNVVITPNGVDAAAYEEPERGKALRRMLGLENTVVLGFVGFAREWHGLEKIVDLLARQPRGNLHFLLVGHGPACPIISARAESLGVKDKVTITGVVEHAQVPDYVMAFDVALQPSVVPYASPLKLFEYLAAGCAVVAPNSANIREILTHEHDALLFSQLEGGGFAAAIQRLLADPALRKRLGAQAKATVRERGLSWAGNARTVIRVAETLIRQKGKDVVVRGARK